MLGCMKYFIFGFIVLSFYVSLEGAPLVAEAPIKEYGTPVTLAISSTTLTKLPTNQTSGRMGVYVSNPATNGDAVSGFLGDCTSTALASTIRPIIISTTPTFNNRYFPIREDVCLWLIALNTAVASTSVHYQEIKQ